MNPTEDEAFERKHLIDYLLALHTSHEELVKALESLLKNPNLYPCEHVSTHRGGSIWSICDDCGAKFADDRGGVPKPHTYPSITQAEKALDNAAKLAPTRTGGSGL
jgi:hypothetical protein